MSDILGIAAPKIKGRMNSGPKNQGSHVLLAAGHAVSACGEGPLGASLKQEPNCVGGILSGCDLVRESSELAPEEDVKKPALSLLRYCGFF